MAGGHKRIRIDGEVDRISELPLNIREHILDCMSITEAVATSVLSSKWRYCWTGLRKLMFNKDFWNFDEDITLLDALEHTRAIDRVLMRHSGPIPEFTLFIPEIMHMTLDINMWLHVLSNHGVQNIEIKVDEYEDTSFPIPSCLFHCRELEKLSLRVCTLTLPTDFKGFANLTSLSLYHVDIAPSLLESLISGCLLLETLTLKYMLIEEPLALQALNLKNFYFDDYWLEFIIFKDTPNLTCVSLLATDQSDKIDIPQPYNTLERLGSLSMIEELTYDLLLLEDVLFTLCLIRSAPNLQNLTFHLGYGTHAVGGKEGMADGDIRIGIDDEMDRISELPVNLREHILDCLSITDAVATSVLSSKWRYCWTGLRKLKFDWHFWGFDLALLDYSKHARAIDRILMLHSGPILEFILSIPEIEHKNETVDINMWLRVLSNNGVQKIEINVDGYEDNSFPTPSCLFQCRELEKLSLRVCKLTFPIHFKGFANLTSLSLYHVKIAPSLLASLISGCLLLETLTLEYMFIEEPLALQALNLKNFYFDDYWLEFIIFKDTPKLTCVSLLATEQTDKFDIPLPYNMLERLSSLSLIKELTFSFMLLRPLPDNLPSCTPTPLENLKCLTLTYVNICLSEDILFTLCLLRSSPNLQSLTIDLHWEYYGDSYIINEEEQEAAAKLLKSEAQKHTSYESVQSLKIIGILGMPSENLLIKLLQTHCQKVKRIITEPCLWKLNADAATEMIVQENP
ncbi:hypothetical protein QQ045_016912 [Rhodiola kirilowii]